MVQWNTWDERSKFGKIGGNRNNQKAWLPRAVTAGKDPSVMHSKCVWYLVLHFKFMDLNVLTKLTHWQNGKFYNTINLERTGIKSYHCWIKSLHPNSQRSGPPGEEPSLSMWWIAFRRELSLLGCPFLPSVSHPLGLLLSHPALMS